MPRTRLRSPVGTRGPVRRAPWLAPLPCAGDCPAGRSWYRAHCEIPANSISTFDSLQFAVTINDSRETGIGVMGVRAPPVLLRSLRQQAGLVIDRGERIEVHGRDPGGLHVMR